MAGRIEVWTDYVLNWHASVPLTADAREDRRVAREAIKAARVAEYGVAGTVEVVRSLVTNHGTAIYSQIPSSGR